MVTFSGVHNRFPMRRRVVTQALRYNPNFAFLMASGIMNSQTQMDRVVADVKAIYLATGGEVLPDLACNISWSDAEGAIDQYIWTRFELLKGMAERINTDLGILNPADGCKWWAKLFIRNYDSDINGNSTTAVPPYMRSTASNRDYVGLQADGGGYGGTGVNANGEYEGKLGAGSAAGATTRQAKIWVPAVANRFKAWMVAIGIKYNAIPTFAGIIINETSLLNAVPGTGMTPSIPTDDSTVVYTYFQRYFQAIIDARPFFDQCEVMISANSPVAPARGMYAMTPLNPSVLYTQHKIGQFIQDGYKSDTPTPKTSTQIICEETQPHAINSCSFAVNLSGDVRRHKAVLGSTFNSTSTVTAGTGTKTFTVPSMSVTNGDPITIMANINEPNQVLMSGTVATATCGALPAAQTCTTTTLVCTITSSSGSGSRSSWKLSTDANYLPPHSLEELVSYAVTEQLGGQGSWGTHDYKGCTHLFFNITAARTGASEGERNYVEYVEYLKTTANRVKTTRPLLY